MSMDSRFCLPPVAARELAERFGTPLYVIDERTLRSQIRHYWEAFAASWDKTKLSYASKANGTLAVLMIAYREGCWIDVASEGELRAALAAGVPAERCVFHGNNKSAREMAAAVDESVGEIVVDNFEELAHWAVIGPDRLPPMLLRLNPGVNPQTHAKISTGQPATKFGFSIAEGEAERAVRYCLGRKLPLIGFHCHVGSQLMDSQAQADGAFALAEFAVRMKRSVGFPAEVLNFGGGLGVRYTDETPVDVAAHCEALVGTVRPMLEAAQLEPTLVQEPGRALVANAGVTIATVGAVKRAGGVRFVAVDCGMADNPRPALYGARYAVVASREGPTEPATVVGRHCEADVIVEDAELPREIQAGDVVQFLTTGAYASSMASNYNRYPRPATVLLRADGRAEPVQRSETYEEMLEREIVPEDL